MSRGFSLFLLLVSLIHLSALWFRLELERSEEDTEVLQVRLINEEQKRQIVQSEDPVEKREPTEDAFLSDKDRSFDKQTKARKVDTFKQSAQGGGGGSHQPKKDLKLSDLNTTSEHPLAASAKEYSRRKNGGPVGDPNNQSQVSSTNDHLEEIPLGDLTQLNTAEYKYYGFYHRIRQKLEQFWGKSIHEKAQTILKEGRYIASDSELVTALRITLNGEGEVIRIEVLGASGIKELDDAAIDSFNQAGPFPNPPKGLVVNGKVVLEWGFVVNT